MKILSALALYVFLAAAGSAQTLPLRFSATTGDVSLSGTGATFTIQQPTSGTPGKQVSLESATVYCSVACNVTQAQNGAAATATAGTANAIQPNPGIPAVATVWTASNVGSGNQVGGILHVPAGATIPIDLSKVAMGNTGTHTNYSIVISSITGTYNVTYIWSEL